MKIATITALLALGVLSTARAAENTEAAGSVLDDVIANSRYVIGASLNANPDYAGSNRRKLKLAPVYAFQYGRFRFSAGGGGGLLNFGTDVVGPGASAELKTTGKIRLGASLRIDPGRSTSDSVDLAGVPDVRRTLRGRFYASSELTQRWTASASVAQDLLGRHGGALLSADLGYALPTSPHTTWTAGGGVAFADHTYMQSYYGVPASASAATGLAPFDAGAGPRDLHLGIGWTSALAPRWVAFASLSGSRLLGDAAASPLTKSRNAVSASVGIGWRCCNQ